MKCRHNSKQVQTLISIFTMSKSAITAPAPSVEFSLGCYCSTMSASTSNLNNLLASKTTDQSWLITETICGETKHSNNKCIVLMIKSVFTHVASSHANLFEEVKEFNSHKVGLEHKHGSCFIVWYTSITAVTLHNYVHDCTVI